MHVLPPLALGGVFIPFSWSEQTHEGPLQLRLCLQQLLISMATRGEDA